MKWIIMDSSGLKDGYIGIKVDEMSANGWKWMKIYGYE